MDFIKEGMNGRKGRKMKNLQLSKKINEKLNKKFLSYYIRNYIVHEYKYIVHRMKIILIYRILQMKYLHK